MHQLKQHSSIDPRCQPIGMLDAEMQDDESLQGQAHEYRDAEQPMLVRHGEQRLHAFDVAHANRQSPFVLADLGHAVGLDGLLNAYSDAVLIDVEK